MISTLSTLFIPIIFGYILVHINFLPKEINKQIKLFVIRVAVPCKIFTSMLDLDLTTIWQILPLTGAFVFTTALLILLSFLIIRVKDKKLKAAYIISIAFGNFGYMGWAVLDASLGPEGLTRGIFYITLWWPVIYLGTFIVGKILKLTGELDVKSYRLNMILPSAVLTLGVIFNLLNIPLYTPLLSSFKVFGNMTTSLILFSVGLSISFRDSYMNLKLALLPVILRPVLGFILSLLVINLIGMSDMISRQSVLIESTMPVAVMSVVLGEMLDLDEKLLSSILIVSTILSLLTIPLTLILVV